MFPALRITALKMVVILGVAMIGLPAVAASITWDGGGDGGSWSSGGNWIGNVAPVANDVLVFDRDSTVATFNDFVAATWFNGFIFNSSAGPFMLTGNTVTLNGTITSHSVNVQTGLAANTQTINNALVLATAPTIHISRKNGAVTLGGSVSGPFGFTKTGPGNAVLAVTNTFTGTINVTSGTLSYGGGGDRLGNVNNSIVLNGGTLRTTTSATIVSSHAITVGNAGGGSGTIDAQNNINYSGVIAGASAVSAFTKTGSSTLTLTGPNTYTGITTLTQGALTLDLNAAASGVTSIINSGSPLVMNGYGTSLNTVSNGTNSPAVFFQGRMDTVSAQTFNGATLNQGNATLVSRSVGNQAATLNLGAITRSAGGVVNFSRIKASAGDSDPAVITTSSNTNGILGGWATTSAVTVSATGQSGTDWAAISGGNVIALPLAGYVIPAGAAPVLANSAVGNVRLDTTSTGNIFLTNAANINNLNTLQMTDVSARVIDITSGNTLRLGVFGGLWKTQGNGNALTIGTSANTGTLTAGGTVNTAGEIVFNANATNSSTTGIAVNSVIANNGSGIVSITKTGLGVVDLAGTNTFTGNTYINSGRISAPGSRSFGGDGTPGGSGTVYIQPGGQAYLSGAATYANHFVIAGNGTAESGNYGAIRVFNAATTIGTSASTITLAGDARIGGSGGSGIATIAARLTGDFNLEFAAANGSPNVVLLTNTGNDLGGNIGINAGALGAGQVSGHISSNSVQLRVGASGVIPNGGGKGNLVIGGGGNAANLATFDLNGFDEIINGLQSVTNGGSQDNTRIINNSTGSGIATLTLGDNDATANFGGRIVNGATALTAITKIGTGTQVLSGANSYTGATSVNGGALCLTGSLATTAVGVNNTGTLTGTGSIGGSVTVNSGGHLGFSVAATAAAQVPLAIAGSLTVSSGNIIDLTASATPAAGQYILASAAGGISYTPGTLNFTGTSGGISVSGNNLILTVGYASWASTNGIAGQPASGDFDKDGLTNLVEYGLGTNPAIPNKSTGTFSGGTIAFTKGSAAIANGDVSFVIEKSADLGKSDPWSPVVTQTAPNGSVTISYTLPAGQPKGFARLKIIWVP
ncbi:MAG: autotransporter-associated beta strand repeat-containing protein [Luteolibacter sp.]|uniref:beta strand repeat-containing protein n=1 Tax=Luteolibacter sp. TaxID=1962973 RepID=UPI003263DBDB